MEKTKLIKFAMIYLLSLILGNIAMYIVDRIGVNHGLTGMSIWNYIIVNAVIIFISYLAYRLAPNNGHSN
ncbi:hypothetical protein [Candidatus Clostridium radicumherbarum]|uniref:Uncharacterized protein n=1 Tax=Candidatus Clostridium radicumherbarum TaxID=3381662 RepID=A0ABW8TWQ9_9CLOT